MFPNPPSCRGEVARHHCRTGARRLDDEERSAMISQELLDILACPACKTKVVLEEEMLVCHACGRKYPIRDGIPIMLIEEGDKALQGKPPAEESGGPR